MMDYIIYIGFILVSIYFLFRFINLLRCEFKYKNVNTNTSGCEIAQKLLDENNVNNTYVIETKNPFEQGYCYGRNVIKLLPFLTIYQNYSFGFFANFVLNMILHNCDFV